MKWASKLATAVSSLVGGGVQFPNVQDVGDALGKPLVPTVQVVGDVYLDIIAKIDALPEWDGDTSIRSPIETVAGGSALNTAVQLTALLQTRRQREQARPFRRCVLHSRVGSDLYGELVAKQIRKAGVALSGRHDGAQGVCICLSGEADRAFVSYKGSVADFTESDIDMSMLLTPGTAHLHFSAYYDCAGLQPAVPKLVQAAKRERGATVSVVPQSDATGNYGECRTEGCRALHACSRAAGRDTTAASHPHPPSRSLLLLLLW